MLDFCSMYYFEDTTCVKVETQYFDSVVWTFSGISASCLKHCVVSPIVEIMIIIDVQHWYLCCCLHALASDVSVC